MMTTIWSENFLSSTDVTSDHLIIYLLLGSEQYFLGQPSVKSMMNHYLYIYWWTTIWSEVSSASVQILVKKFISICTDADVSICTDADNSLSLAPPLEELYICNSDLLPYCLPPCLTALLRQIFAMPLFQPISLLPHPSISLYLCHFNSDHYETLNLSSWGTN